MLTYSDGTTANLGKVKGEDGQDGEDGRGIQSMSISIDGELIVTYTDSTVVNLGNIKGEKGDKGDRGEKGEKGDAGRGIAKTELVNGELIITYTDGTKENLGGITSEYADTGYLKFTKIYGKEEYQVQIKDEYRTTVTSITVPSHYNGLPVTELGMIAFRQCTNLKNIILPNTISTFGLESFYEAGITDIVIPNGVESIPGHSFARCKS